jgi:hypothetical protein
MYLGSLHLHQSTCEVQISLHKIGFDILQVLLQFRMLCIESGCSNPDISNATVNSSQSRGTLQLCDTKVETILLCRRLKIARCMRKLHDP